MKTLLKGGTVVSGSGLRVADVLLDGEKIAAVGKDLSCPEGKITDVAGKLLFPGFIDAHTHFDLDVCGTTTADNFESGTASAVCGGTTTVLDFACPNKGERLAYGLALWRKKAAHCSCDYGFHMTIDDWNDDIRRELSDMTAEGITSFKLYLTYPAMMLPDRDIFAALQAMKDVGGLVGVHCENSGMIDKLIADAKAQGALSPASHPLTRPAAAEAEAVARLLRMAQVAEVPVVIVHLSTAAALEEVRAARRRGQTVFVETCPQYLLLEDTVYSRSFEDAAGSVCAPPLRKTEDQRALWDALEKGEIQTVSTDHCSFTPTQKAAGREDFTKIPGGVPGVETRGILLYSEGVAKSRISPQVLCRVLAETPARQYGMFPRKGILAPGSDGDVVVLDPNAADTVTAKTLHSKAGYTPFEGLAVTGKIEQVYLRGQLVAENGSLLQGGLGTYIKRKKTVV